VKTHQVSLIGKKGIPNTKKNQGRKGRRNRGGEVSWQKTLGVKKSREDNRLKRKAFGDGRGKRKKHQKPNLREKARRKTARSQWLYSKKRARKTKSEKKRQETA